MAPRRPAEGDARNPAAGVVRDLRLPVYALLVYALSLDRDLHFGLVRSALAAVAGLEIAALILPTRICDPVQRAACALWLAGWWVPHLQPFLYWLDRSLWPTDSVFGVTYSWIARATVAVIPMGAIAWCLSESVVRRGLPFLALLTIVGTSLGVAN